MNRREYALTVLAIALAGLGIVVAYGSTWIVATVPVFPGEPVPTTQESLTGGSLIALGPAAGWVALAAAGGIIATRTWGRRVIGAVAVLAGAAAGVGAMTFIASREALIRTALQEAQVQSVQGNAWWLLAALGGLVVMIGGAWTVLRGATWAGLGSRYERTRPADRDGEDAVNPVSVWDALDRGEDPTAR